MIRQETVRPSDASQYCFAMQLRSLPVFPVAIPRFSGESWFSSNIKQLCLNVWLSFHNWQAPYTQLEVFETAQNLVSTSCKILFQLWVWHHHNWPVEYEPDFIYTIPAWWCNSTSVCAYVQDCFLDTYQLHVQGKRLFQIFWSRTSRPKPPTVASGWLWL